ncbi:MAG TPA: ParB/RepB/Spo0J family partition protein [Chloroflexota bacterium]|nr:ParB/RepB/Spo0J family partition protein [Chloroflexota bacterium]
MSSPPRSARGAVLPAHASRPGATSRPGDQIWSRLFADPSGVRAFPDARRIPLDLIDDNPDQPRTSLAGIDELAAQIAEYGLLQPIVVSGPVDGRYTLVAGHRRLAALRLLRSQATPNGATWDDMPAVIRSVQTADRLILAVAENVSRHALTDAEIVTAVRLLRDLHQWSQSEIARRLGVSRQWISQYFQGIEDPELAQRIQSGELSTAKAYEVRRAKTPRARQRALDAALRGAPLQDIRRVAGDGGGDIAPTSVPTPAPAAATIEDRGADDPVSSDLTAPAARGGATEIELTALRTTELVRSCVARGIRRVRLDTLLRSLEADLNDLRGPQS